MSDVEDLIELNHLRSRYSKVMWMSGKRSKMPLAIGRVVVKIKHDMLAGRIEAKVYAGLNKGTKWLSMKALPAEIELAFRNCTNDPSAPVITMPMMRSSLNRRGQELIEKSGGRMSRVNNRYFRVSWDPGPKCWLRFSNTTASRVRSWSDSDKEKLFSEGLYAWVVQFNDERELVRLKYAFTTFATEWMHEDPMSFKQLIISAQHYADTRNWRRMEL